MSRDIPLVGISFNSVNWPIPVMLNAGLNCLRVEKIGNMDKTGNPTCSVKVDPILKAIVNLEKQESVLELKEIE